MTTQSLRGMDNQGPMHWRGDRTGAALEPSAQPNSGHFNERLAFKAFNVAFPGLLGRDSQIPDADMEAFTSFILEVMYPPNPIRNLDNSFTQQQQLGFDIFFGPKTFFDPLAPAPNGAGLFACGDCHALNPTANAGLTTKPGFFGSNTLSAEVGTPINVKTPHLRNLYQKVGKFGFPLSPLFLPSPGPGSSVVTRSVALASPTMAASTPPSPSALPRTSGVAWRTPTSRSPSSRRSWASRLTTRRASRCSRLASPSTRRLMSI